MSKRTVLAKGVAMSAESRVTRRAALGALAGASIFPQISDIVAEQADPVIAVLQRHKAVWVAADAPSPSVDDVLAKRKGRKASQVDRDAHERASSREAEALDELLATPPTTAAGLRAAIEHLVSFDDGCLSESARPLLATFLAILKIWRVRAH